jgi:hypothetical protein
VAVHKVLTGTAAAGDLGTAANLALDALAVPGVMPEAGPEGGFVVFLCAGGRLDAGAFAMARARIEAGDIDALSCPLRQWSLDLGRVVDGPDLAARGDDPLDIALSRQPGLDGILLRWPVTDRCAEGQSSFGALGFWWRAITRAAGRGRLGVMTDPLGHRAHPADPDAGLFQALTDLIGQNQSVTKWAAKWADTALPRLLTGLTPGGIAGLLAAGPALAEVIGDAGSGAVIRAFARNDLPAARQALQALRQRPMSDPELLAQSLFSTPALQTHPAPMRVCVTGKHAHRQPFAYAALAPLWADRVALTGSATQTDLIVIAHPHNLLDLRPDLAEAAARGTPVALISEEPFWDSLFSPDPLAHRVTLPAAHLGAVRAHQVTHHRSAIFDFDRIPYFLLTDPGYVARYAALFSRNAAVTAADWAEAFAQRPYDITFMAERRPEAFHDVRFAAGDITGLCAWRTRLALGCRGPGVQRLGASWGVGPSRFDLTDWHADKIAQLDGQTKVLSGIENTHQPTYLSEKLFDAFACGARPLYVASPGHRVHDLGLPAGAWLNLWGHSPETAQNAIDGAIVGASWDPGFYSAYAAAQGRLAALFTDADILAAERTRLGRALVAEVDRLIQCGPA